RLLALDPGARGDLDATAAELRRLAPRLSTQPTAPIEPELRERDATAAFTYDPVTPHAADIDHGAIGAMLAAESHGDGRDAVPGDESGGRPRRGLMVLAAATGLVLIAALWALWAVASPDLPSEEDVADPSEKAASSAPAEDETSPEPTEPATEESPTPGEESTVPQGPDSDSDTPDQESDEMSESEDNGGDSTEGGSDDDSPGSDLIGSPMPDN
ncbi:MAG TPA: hypothetical protein VHG10_07680, partial [Glycomyces sp.]|nr:hypothetical protein [Glycomyces sp.]